MKNDRAISETVSVILLILMMLILAGVVAGLLFGANLFQQKSAYIAIDIQHISVQGNEFIRIYSRGGDTAYLDQNGRQQYTVSVYADTTSGSFRLQPPSGAEAFSPGTTLFVYNTIPGIYKITNNSADLSVAAPPASLTGVRLVDDKSHQLLAQWQRSAGGNSSSSLSVTGITPASWWAGSTAIISSIDGTGFVSGSTPALKRGAVTIAATNISVISPSRISCNFIIPPLAATGLWDVTVTNPGVGSATLANGFTVSAMMPLPTVASVNAPTGYRGWPVVERITGTNFVSGSTSKLNRAGTPDIPATSCTFVSSTRLDCTYNLLLKDVTPPNYNVTVINPDGRSGWRAAYFIISSPAPTITSSTPNSGIQGATISITRLRGTNFQPGATAVYSNGTTNIPLNGANVVNSTSITGTLTIPVGAPTGPYSVTVQNTDGKSVTRANTFTVTSNAPTVSSITPNTYVRGWPVSITNLVGTRFQNGATVKLVNATAGPDITATNVVVVSATKITCTFDLTGAPAARRTVTVTNPDGKTGTLANGFTITSNAPTQTARNPTTGIRGWPVSIISLTGTGFQPGAEVRLRRSGYSDVIATGVNVASPTSINAGTFDLTGVTAGTWNIVVINGDGKASGTMTFTVTNPTLTARNPTTGIRGWPVSIISLTGTGFRPGAEVHLQRSGNPDVIATGVNVASSTSINAGTFNLLGVTAGTWTIRVINADGGTSGTMAFTVNSLAPTFTGVTPNTAARGTTVSITNLAGNNFQPGATVQLRNATTVISTDLSPNVASSSQITCQFTIPSSGVRTGTNAYYIRVTNTGGVAGNSGNIFSIT